jgi:hypothetical protein
MVQRMFAPTAYAAAEIVGALMLAPTRTELDIGDVILRYACGENETSVLDASVHKIAHALAHDPVSAVALVEAVLVALEMR